MQPKRLYRSETDRMIAGVCGGLGEYFQIDPVIVRLVTVLLAFASGVGVIAYILLWIIVPRQSRMEATSQEIVRENVENIRERAEEWGQGVRSVFGRRQPSPEGEAQAAAPGVGSWVAAVVLILIGLIFLLQNLGLFSWWRWGNLWPLILIVIGIALLLRRK